MLNLVLKSKKTDGHRANATYDGAKINVLKGSKISPAFVDYIKFSSVQALRNDRTIVGDDWTLLKDVEFNSLSAAGVFVTGRSVNGNICWRPDDKMSMKDYKKANK